MKKEEVITKYGGVAYDKKLKQARQWRIDNPEKAREDRRKQNEQHNRKDGKYYLKTLRYNTTGIQGERNKIRKNHAHKWRRFKKIIAPATQIHHEWVSGTSRFRGVALVEKDQHMHGIIDVIKILDGEITLLVEEKLKYVE